MAALLGRQCRPHDLAHLRHRRRARRRRRPDVPALLRRDRLLHRLRRRHQGVHRRGARRHRLAARRHAGRADHRPDRGLLVRIFHDGIQGRRGLLHPGDRADLLSDPGCSAGRRSKRFEPWRKRRAQPSAPRRKVRKWRTRSRMPRSPAASRCCSSSPSSASRPRMRKRGLPSSSGLAPPSASRSGSALSACCSTCSSGENWSAPTPSPVCCPPDCRAPRSSA